MSYVFVCDGQCGCSRAVLNVLCVANVPKTVVGKFCSLWLFVFWCVMEGVHGWCVAL